MVGPFVQGALLFGVIYWYSKGMINMINEYYRHEFQKQLVDTTPSVAPTDRAPDATTATDEIELLLKQEQEHTTTDFLGQFPNINEDDYSTLKTDLHACLYESELKRFLESTLMVCFDANGNSNVFGRVSNI